MGFAFFVMGALIVETVLRGAIDPDATSKDVEANPSRIVAGQILDVDGKPARNARVVWSLGLNRRATGQDCVHVTTDENGNFRIRSPAGYVSCVRDFPTDRLWVHSPGADVLTVPAADAEIAPGERAFWKGQLQRSSGERLRVQVLDPEGRALQGELVELSQVVFDNRYGMVPQLIREQTSAITDADGIAVLKGYPEDWQCPTFNVISEQYGWVRFHGPLGQAEATPVVVTLAPAARLEGQILRSDQRPIKRTCLVIFSTGDGEKFPRSQSILGRGHAICETDQHGRFAIPAIAAGQLRVEGRGRGEAAETSVIPSQVTLEPGAITKVEIKMQATVVVAGRVVLAANQQPVPNADVELKSADGDFVVVRTDQQGIYRARVPPGMTNATCLVTEPGIDSPVRASWHDGPDTVEVLSGPEIAPLPPLELRDFTLVEGHVTDQMGHPVQRKRIIGVEMGLVHGIARTDDHGRFRMYCPTGKRVTGFEIWIEGQSREARISSQSPLELTVERP